ncbi:hypothetical protein [Sphingosinicella sp.]|uniref:hypothetical protein n=1 Tax=Sphingosinicella sp. TaxID=1917971 RepID=UPI00403804CE
MRILIAAPLLLVAGCSVQNDPRNGQTTIGFDETIVTNTTNQLGNAVESTAAELNRAGQELRNEARSIDVDVDIRRRPPGNTGNSN